MVSFLDTATKHLGIDLEIGRIAVGADSSFARKTNETSRIRQERVIVLAIKQGQGRRFNPVSDDRIEAEDFLILMGEPAQLRQIEQMAGSRS